MATPIGETEDLSPRARQILGTVDRVAAEDTRTAARLLREIGVTARALESYHDHNERKRAPALVARLLAGESVALVSEAGTPIVADPGYRLVQAALEADVPVVVVPGPCAAVAALSGAGLPAQPFLFLGFLPRDPGPRAALLQARRFEPATAVLYEAPHRVLETLGALAEAWGDRPAALVRNLTKPHEAWLRGTVGSVRAALAAEEEVRGEITLVVAGYDGPPSAAADAQVDALIDQLVDAGVSVQVVRDVVGSVYARSRRDVYQRALKRRAARDDEDEDEP
ncbi:MAG: 16S rRNA (cytidine(1402)-2'-O)-methyltransferase [Myxococcota bacterium]